MKTWKGKFILLLIVYFAGFATAIYTLAPVPQDSEQQSAQHSFPDSALKSDSFAVSLNVQLHRAVDYAKVAAKDLGEFIKEKMSELKANG